MTVNKMITSYLTVFMFLCGFLLLCKNQEDLIGTIVNSTSSDYDKYFSKQMEPYSDDIYEILEDNGFEVTLIADNGFSNFMADMYIEIQ